MPESFSKWDADPHLGTRDETRLHLKVYADEDRGDSNPVSAALIDAAGAGTMAALARAKHSPRGSLQGVAPQTATQPSRLREVPVPLAAAGGNPQSLGASGNHASGAQNLAWSASPWSAWRDRFSHGFVVPCATWSELASENCAKTSASIWPR